MILSVLLLTPRAGAISTKEIITKVEERYENMADFRADFHQSVYLDSADTAGYVATGVLWVKKPHKFRLELKHQTTVSDGDTLWTYVPGNAQVLVDYADTTGAASSPEQLFLKYFRDAEVRLVGSEQITGLDCYHLHLRPECDQDICSLHLWVDQQTWLVRRLEFTDSGDMVTHYWFTETRTNLGLDENIFIFQAPDGVEIIDMRW
jgi:chaperone LolA